VSKTVRIAGASGFWGDSAIALPQLLREPLEYVTFDFLAEITLSIMARARAKDPQAGYATDFVDMIGRHAVQLADHKVKVIANAGGVNPHACARALEQRLTAAGIPLKVGVVLGDDLLDRAAQWRAEGRREMFTGAPMPEHLLSLNAYLGAEPIAAALAAGADIVVTGRCVDSAMTLGACLHEFSWSRGDLDRLAGGSLAGHIIECGAQVTGGIHTDWEKTGDWANIGYPVVEISEDGSFTLSKPKRTGGLVSVGTAAEQMVYEIGNPAAYVLPDVVCDFTQVNIREAGPGKVHFSGARGRPPTATYKASATWSDGFRVGAYYMIAGIDAAAKADKVADAVFRRCDEMLREQRLPPFTETSHEAIGAEATYGPASRARGTREVMLKLAAKNPSPRALEILVREFTSAGTSMAPGFTGLGGNRPKVMPVVRLFSLLVPKTEVDVHVLVRETGGPLADACGRGEGLITAPPSPEVAAAAPLAPATEAVPLIRLAWGRSGDKGNAVNIGIIARRPEYAPYIRAALTPRAVARVFAHYLEGPVERFDLPGSHAINFLLHDVLGGGGTASLRNDPQGKAYAQILLDYPIPVPADLIHE
jgi:Acyclic terpene utilisation family protein AtuA